jgi:hypothetical protein
MLYRVHLTMNRVQTYNSGWWQTYHTFITTPSKNLVYGIYCHFQQYFSYIMAVSFIDGGNQNNWRIPITGRKSLTNLIT